MSSDSEDNNVPSSHTERDEEVRRRYQSKNISGQKLDSEEVIEISSSDSEQAIATNEQIINESMQLATQRLLVVEVRITITYVKH